MNKQSYIAVVFVCGIAIGTIVANVLGISQPQQAQAQASSGSSNGLIAVTGLVSNNFSGLWVIDTNDTQFSPSLALYIPTSSGRIRLAATRRIKYDLKLLKYNDRTDKKYSPSNLKSQLQKFNKDAEKK